MKLYCKKSILSFWTITCTTFAIISLCTTSCSYSSNTINPFYSSFEDNDPIPLSNEQVTPPTNITSLQTQLSNGPSHGYGTHVNFGYTGFKSFEYKATYTNDQTQTQFSNYIFKDLNIIVGSDTEFSYKIFPNFADSSDDDLKHNLNYLSTFTSIDLLYNNNGTDRNLMSLSATGIKDTNGNGISPMEQGLSKSLFSYQWNLVKVDLNPIVGKHIHQIVINYDMFSPDCTKEIYGDRLDGDTNVNHIINGFIDDISIKDKVKIDTSSLTNYVDTRRGTDGHMDWSRGSTFPATTLPHGFNFYTPVQHARLDSSGDADWLYNYKKFNDDNNLPTLNAFAISHIPAPWMHDYDQMQIMPQLGSTGGVVAKAKSEERRYEYSHDNEIAHPDYYSVQFNNGLKTEITPGDHSAIFRFTFPQNQSIGRIIFDSLFKTANGNNRGTDKFFFNNNTISGFVDNGAWGSGNYRGGQTRMFIYGEFSSNFTHAQSEGDYSTLRDYCEFDLNSIKTIELKIATSFISQTQAQHNLNLEIKDDNLNFNALHKNASKIWNEKLNVLNMSSSNATEEQKKIIYGCLYRLNLYPNESFENVNTKQEPHYKHVSSVLPTIGDATDATTNAQIFDGKTYVNNGFWDTYRTFWPIYSILYPHFLKELIYGFLYQYQEGGFVSRWSAPGNTDCMTGTSSDCAFANAYVNGSVDNIDTAINIYKSGLADSFTYSPNSDVGRKGLDHSMYRGWTSPSDISNGENTLDWDFQGWINDYALGQMAIKLSQDHNLTDSLAQLVIGQTKQQIKDTGKYLLNRSNNYVNLFNPNNDAGAPNNPNTNGFFRSRNNNGSWFSHNQQGDTYYDGRQWGYENVEASGWNFAFTPTYDIDGLIGCYGGQQNFLNKLDLFFDIPETGQHMGSIPASWGVYSFTRETRDVGFGECVITNQPSHHIPYMYAEAGRPAKTQYLTRTMLHRLFVGNDIGQGYCGDEDNGEMSSWYILSMLGLYDIALGKDQYVATSPMLNNVTINRDNGNKITIKTDDRSGNKYYIKSAKLDHNSLNDAHIIASALLNGNHTISYQMSPTPTNWGNKNITGQTRSFMTDKCLDNEFDSNSDVTDIENLTDGDATTLTYFSSNNITLEWEVANPIKINTVGLTSGGSSLMFNTIKIESYIDSNWVILDELQDQAINKYYETRIYSFANNTSSTKYRLTLQVNSISWCLGEIQFL